jgi:hypothetical protein
MGKRALRGKKEEASNTFVLVTSMCTYNVGGTNSCTCEPHDITINLTEMVENVFLKDNYVLDMFRVLICSRVKTTPKSDSSKHYYIKMGIKK